MTPFAEDHLISTMPLTLKQHHIAERFRQQHANLQKAKQVYLNTLAVQAVNAYLGWLGVDSDLTAGDSWNPVMQTLADVADLMITTKGRLECRPVLPDQGVCQMPPETWSDRIGYVVVQLNRDLSEATLLGFVPSVTTQELPLSELRSLDQLLEHLNQITQPRLAPIPTQLGQWLQGVVDGGWHTLEAVLGLQEPAFSFRNINSTPIASPASMTRGKLLDLATQPERTQIAFLVGILPTAKPDLEIWVKVCPTGAHTHLPPELEVLVLDNAGVVVMQAQSRHTEMIQLKFSGLPGERFSIRVILDTINFTEDFVI